MAVKNKQTDLNDILFGQMERLNDDEHMREHGASELERARQISNVGKTIISNMKLALEVSKHVTEYQVDNKDMPKILTNE